MFGRAATLSLLFLVFLSWSPALSQRATTDVPIDTTVPADERFDPIRRSLLERIEEGDVPSVAVAVATSGQLLWAEAIGWSDLASSRAARPTTSYLVGSLSKSLTAVLAVAVAEDGLIDLDEPVDRFVRIPAHGKIRRSPTLRELLDSTAGLPHGWRTMPEGSSPSTREDWDRWLASDAFLAFPPGVVFEYSNLSLGVAARVAERAAGTSFDTLIRRRLFEPLGMTASFARRDPTDAGPVATPYARVNGRLEPRQAALVPEGGLGMYASVLDLVRFGQSMLGTVPAGGQAAISASSLDAFRRPASGPGRPFFHFGFWNTGRTFVTNGNVTGANAHLALIPSTSTVVAVAVNATGSVADETADSIVAALIGSPAADGPNSAAAYEATHRTPIAADAVVAGRWTGAVLTSAGRVPMTLDVSPPAAEVRIGDGPSARMESVSFNAFRELRGVLRTVPPQLQPGHDDVAVALRFEAARLEGYLLPRGPQAVPLDVVLTRR